MTGWTATVGSELLNSQTPSFPSMIIWFAASKCFIVAFCIPKKKKKLKTECVGCLQSISPCYQEIVEQGLPHNCTCVSAFERGVSSASPKSGSISHYAIWSFFDHMSHHWLLLFGSASISQAWMTQLALQFSPNTSSTSLGKPVQDEDISSTLAVFFTCFHKNKKKKRHKLARSRSVDTRQLCSHCFCPKGQAESNDESSLYLFLVKPVDHTVYVQFYLYITLGWRQITSRATV